MPKINRDEIDDGEEAIRLFIEALARDAARYEFRRQLERGKKDGPENERGKDCDRK